MSLPLHFTSSFESFRVTNGDEKLPKSFHLARANLLEAEEIEAHRRKQGHPLFVYGSLMLPRVLGRVINYEDIKELTRLMTPGLLHGYTRQCVYGAGYPALVQCKESLSQIPQHTVSGFLVFGLNRWERRDIERFESDVYSVRNVPVIVRTKGGIEMNILAKAYVWTRGDDELIDLDEEEWTFQKFMDSDLGRHMLEEYHGVIEDVDNVKDPAEGNIKEATQKLEKGQ